MWANRPGTSRLRAIASVVRETPGMVEQDAEHAIPAPNWTSGSSGGRRFRQDHAAVSRWRQVDGTTEVDGDCADEAVEGKHAEKRKGNRSGDRALGVSNLFAECGDPGVSGKGKEEKAGGLKSAKHTRRCEIDTGLRGLGDADPHHATDRDKRNDEEHLRDGRRALQAPDDG